MERYSGPKNVRRLTDREAREFHNAMHGGGVKGIVDRILSKEGVKSVAEATLVVGTPISAATVAAHLSAPVAEAQTPCLLRVSPRGTEANFSSPLTFLDISNPASPREIRSANVQIGNNRDQYGYVGNSVDINAPSTNGRTYSNLSVRTLTDVAATVSGNCGAERIVFVKPERGTTAPPPVSGGRRWWENLGYSIENFFGDPERIQGLVIGGILGLLAGVVISDRLRGGELRRVTRERDQLRTDLTARTNDLNARTTERNNLQTQLTNVQNTLTTRTQERDNLQTQLTQAQADLTARTNDLTARTTERNNLQTQLTQAQADLATRTTERNNLQTQLTTEQGVRQAAELQRDNATNQVQLATGHSRRRLVGANTIEELGIKRTTVNPGAAPTEDFIPL